MKFWKKINKGLVLTLIVLVVLIIYLIYTENVRNSAKPEIESACRDYIGLICDYAVMPKDVDKVYNTMDLSLEDKQKIEEDTKNKITSHMDKFEEELKKRMVNNDLAISIQKDAVESFLTNDNNVFNSIITKNNHQITKIKKFVFDGDQVTVTFVSNVEQEMKYINDEGEEISKKNSFTTMDETVTFQEVDGTWKVVYADLQYYDYTASSVSVQYVY